MLSLDYLPSIQYQLVHVPEPRGAYGAQADYVTHDQDAVERFRQR
jgi:hypothetical protein